MNSTITPQFTPIELETEEWRDVVGYEGWYAVSSLAQVKRTGNHGGAKVGRIIAQTTPKSTGRFVVCRPCPKTLPKTKPTKKSLGQPKSPIHLTSGSR